MGKSLRVNTHTHTHTVIIFKELAHSGWCVYNVKFAYFQGFMASLQSRLQDCAKFLHHAEHTHQQQSNQS